MNIWHPHEHKLLKPRFIAFGLSFRLHFQQQFISPSFLTMRFLHSVAVLLSPGFAYDADGTQSTFHLSHRTDELLYQNENAPRIQDRIRGFCS